MKRVKAFERFMVDNGLLFEINRKVLHPLGLALIIDVDYNNRRKLAITGLIETDDPEGFIFDEETFELGMEKFSKYMKRIGDKRLESRQEKFGFEEEEIANVEELISQQK